MLDVEDMRDLALGHMDSNSNFGLLIILELITRIRCFASLVNKITADRQCILCDSYDISLD
jgi:hypothetical protein